MQTTSIHDLAELVSDEALYPAREGYRRPDSPAFIFRDERDREIPSDLLWGRELALDFEEWVEKQNTREAYLKGELIPAFVPHHTEPRADALDFILATMSEVEEWMDRPTRDKRPVMLQKGPDGIWKEWSAPTAAEVSAFLERQESRGFCNWLVQWHKRRPANNDHWRTFLAPLANVLDDPSLGSTAKAILHGAKEALPFAPGPVKQTVFINPDKSRVTTNLAPGTAKAGYKARHGIAEEFVTMDRVQYEGERQSRYVIGTRKASDKTPSSYYDPDPVKDEKGYIPRACVLMRLDPKCPVMPDEKCHRLTVRELERAIIAGAELCEDEFEAFAATLENEESQFDTRESGLSFSGSCDYRTMLDLDEQESWLYWTLYGAGLEDACKELTLRECSDIGRFLPGMDEACLSLGNPDAELSEEAELALELLQAAREQDLLELEKTGRVQWSRYEYLRHLA